MRIKVLVIVLLFSPTLCFSETPKERYQKIKKEIKVHKDKLQRVKKKERSVIEDIEKLDKELNRITYAVKNQREEIKKMNVKISSVRTELMKITKTLDIQKIQLRKKLRTMQRYDDSLNRLMVLLNSHDFFEILRMNRYLTSVSKYDYRQIMSYRETSKRLSQKKNQYNSLLVQLKRKNKELNSTENLLLKKKREKKYLLLSIEKEQTLYTSMLRELEEASSRLKKLIEIAEKSLNYAGKGFYKMRGRLPWPVYGDVAIPYGSHRDPRFKIPVFRNGIYISTKEDIDVKAIHSGRIVFADWFKGLGQVVIINHGMGYHSVYANLSRIFSKVGVIINKTDILGKAGNSGVLNGPGIYFEVRYKGKPTDPLRWLIKK